MVLFMCENVHTGGQSRMLRTELCVSPTVSPQIHSMLKSSVPHDSLRKKDFMKVIKVK